MSKITIPYDEDDDKPRKLGPGKYNALIINCVNTKSLSGNNQIIITYQIDNRNFEIKQYFIIEKEHRWRFKEFMSKIFNRIMPPGLLEFDNIDVIGKSCIVELVNKEYNGKTFLNVKDVESIKDTNRIIQDEMIYQDDKKQIELDSTRQDDIVEIPDEDIPF